MTGKNKKNGFVLLHVGDTERQILSAIEEIVEESLPVSKMTAHYKDPEKQNCVFSTRSLSVRHVRR